MNFSKLCIGVSALALSASALATATVDGTSPEGYAGQITLNPVIPPANEDRRISTNISAPEVAPTPVAAPVAIAPVVPVDPALANLPRVAASGEEPAPGAQPAETAGFIPGQPVPVYGTLGEAAQAGIDPLNDLGDIALAHPSLELSPPFEWDNVDAYLDWIAAHPDYAMGVGGGALASILLGMGFAMRRRVGARG